MTGGCRTGWSIRRASRWRRWRRTSGTCRPRGGRRRRCAPMGWICCAGSGSCGRSGWRGTGRRGSRRGTSVGGCRWRASRLARTGAPDEPRRRRLDGAGVFGVGAGAQRDGAALLLRLPPRCGRRADRQPVPAGPVAAGRPGARAPQSDGAATATSGPGCTGRRCRPGSRAAIPDEEFNEIFARLPSHRDRALVAFYVSTGARASELLSVTAGRGRPGPAADHGGAQGKSRDAGAAGVHRRVRVVAALPGARCEGLIPQRAAAAVVVDVATPLRPLTYHAVHRMFERAGAAAGSTATLHALRHTAAYRMAEDPALPLTDVQFVLGHAQLTTTQIYLTPRKEDVIRRVLAHHAEQTRQAAERIGPAAGAGLPARDAGRCCSGPSRDDRPRSTTSQRPARDRPSPTAASGGARLGFPPRRSPTSWPATEPDREQRGGQRLTAPPFVVGQAQHARRPRGAGCGCCWTGWPISPARPGRSGGWPAAPKRPARAGGRSRPSWLHDTATDAPWRRDGAVRALLIAIGADLIRPSLTGCVGASGQRQLGRDLVQRPRSRAGSPGCGHCATATPTSPRRPRAASLLPRRADPRGQGRRARRHHRRRRPGAARRRGATRYGSRGRRHRAVLPGAAASGRLRRRTRRRRCGSCAPRAAHPRGADRPLPARSADPIRDLLVDYLRERQPALDYTSLESLAYFLGKLFWADLERHHPGIDSLHLPAEVADAWKQRLRTMTKTTAAPTGETTAVDVPTDQLPRVPDPGAGVLPRPGALGRRGPGPLGPVGGALPGRRRGDQPAKGQAAPQGPHGRPHPRTAAGAAGAGRAASTSGAEDAAALLDAARQTQPGETVHRRRADPDPRVDPPRRRAGKVWADDPAPGNAAT